MTNYFLNLLNQGIQALFIQLIIHGKFLCTFCYCKKKEYNNEQKAISTMPHNLNSRERQTLTKKFTVVEGNDHSQEGDTREFSTLSWTGCGLCRTIRESLTEEAVFEQTPE